MESRFGHDFSGVRIHTDSRAAESARQLDAHAYTVGRHVVFGKGRFQPDSPAGRHLLAHELVHVMQQAGTSAEAPLPARASLEVGPPQDSFEREAEAFAKAAVALPLPHRSPVRLVQRWPLSTQATSNPQPPAGSLPLEMRRQIAAQLRESMQGLGTDETSIYSALAGRTPGQIEEIRQTYEEMYRGRRLADDLRDELTAGELRRLAASAPTAVLPQDEEGRQPEEVTPEKRADAVAARLNAAMDRLGTDEDAIFSALTGRPQSELSLIKDAYKRLTKRELEADLERELSGEDHKRAVILLAKGALEPEDQIWVATRGLGTNEHLLFEALERIAKDPVRIAATIEAYRAKGYGEDMLRDVREDLSGNDLARAVELLHGTATQSTDCSEKQRGEALEALSRAASMARNAITKLQNAIAEGLPSGRVKQALEENFNPGGLAGGVTMTLAQKVLDVLTMSLEEISKKSNVRCSTPAKFPCMNDPKFIDCDPFPTCPARVPAWTCNSATFIRLCPAFFKCSGDQPTKLLHEFIHHQGPRDKSYKSPIRNDLTAGIPENQSRKLIDYQNIWYRIKPLSDDSDLDSVYNADSYAQVAKDLR